MVVAFREVVCKMVQRDLTEGRGSRYQVGFISMVQLDLERIQRAHSCVHYSSAEKVADKHTHRVLVQAVRTAEDVPLGEPRSQKDNSIYNHRALPDLVPEEQRFERPCQILQNRIVVRGSGGKYGGVQIACGIALTTLSRRRRARLFFGLNCDSVKLDEVVFGLSFDLPASSRFSSRKEASRCFCYKKNRF